MTTLCDWLLLCALTTPMGGNESLNERAVLYDYYDGRGLDAIVRATSIASGSSLAPAEREELALLAQTVAYESNVAVERFAPFALEEVDLDAAQRLRLHVARARSHHWRQRWSELEGDVDSAEAVLATLASSGASVEDDMRTEVAFLRAEQLIATGRFERAKAIVLAMPVKDARRAYAMYNLAVAQYTAGALDLAEASLQELAGADVYTHDALDLKSRAAIALALVRLLQTKSASAEAALRTVPAQSRYRDGALAKFGEQAMIDGEWELAARLWTTVLADQKWSATGVTAQLALPMSLEFSETPAQLLARYRDIEQAYTMRAAALRQLLARIEGDETWCKAVLRGIAYSFAGGEPATLDQFDEFTAAVDHPDWVGWFSEEDTQRVLDGLLTVDSMIAQLEARAAQLRALNVVAADNRERAVKIRRAIEAHDLDARLARIASKTAVVSGLIEQLADDPETDADSVQQYRTAIATFEAEDEATRARVLHAETAADAMERWAAKFDLDDASTRIRDLVNRLAAVRDDLDRDLADRLHVHVQSEVDVLDEQMRATKLAMAHTMDRVTDESRGDR